MNRVGNLFKIIKMKKIFLLGLVTLGFASFANTNTTIEDLDIKDDECVTEIVYHYDNRGDLIGWGRKQEC